MPASLHLCTETLQHQKLRLREGQGLVQGHTASSSPHAQVFEGDQLRGSPWPTQLQKDQRWGGCSLTEFWSQFFLIGSLLSRSIPGQQQRMSSLFWGDNLQEPVVPPGSRTSPCGSGALMWFSSALHSVPGGGEGSSKSPEARRGKRQACKQIKGRLCRVVDDGC